MADSYSRCFIFGPVPPGTTGKPPGAWLIGTYSTAQNARDHLSQILQGAASSTGSAARVEQYVQASRALDAGLVDQAEAEGYSYLVVPGYEASAWGSSQSSGPNVVTTTV